MNGNGKYKDAIINDSASVTRIFWHGMVGSVRVGNELGAGHPKSAAFSVVVVTLVSFLISVVAAALVLVLRHVISYAFTGGETVAQAVSDLCPVLAITLMLNGIQPVLSGKIPTPYPTPPMLLATCKLN